jgi:hypothetical protein
MNSDSATIPRVFTGNARQRMQELRVHVTFLLRNRGMQDLLTAMTAVLENVPYTNEPYVRTLIHDLKLALRHYKARYCDEQTRRVDAADARVFQRQTAETVEAACELDRCVRAWAKAECGVTEADAVLAALSAYDDTVEKATRGT